MNIWQGRLVRLRGVEPSDAETFARRTLVIYTGGQFYDVYRYGMLKEEWEQSAHRI